MIEKVTDEPKDETYYRNRISEEIVKFYRNCSIPKEKIMDAPLNTWSACMRYVHDRCINRKDLMIPYCIGGNGSKAMSYKYDDNIVDMLLGIFLAECELFDKVPSVWAFAALTGIDLDTLEEWRINYRHRELTPKRVGIMKKLGVARELALSNRISDGRRNPVGSIAVLNHEYSWNTEKIESADNRGSALALSDIPRLPVFHDDGRIENNDLLNVSQLESIPKL